MKNFLCLFPFFFLFLLFPPVSIAQLSASESRIMFQVQQFLEYPQVFQGWNNWTNFCYLPWSPSVVIVCSENHITEITVIGNKTSPSQFPNPTSANSAISQLTLSSKFSIDAFFTTLTKLSNLKVLSLASLGLWGPLPAKIIQFSSLEVLNMSSNFIYGSIPASLATLKNLRSLVLADNLLNGTVPDLRSLQVLEELDLGRNQLGPKFPTLGNTLVSIILKNNSFRSHIPLELINFAQLQRFDVSSNKLVGPIPSSLFALPSIQYLSLAKNQFSGALLTNISCSAKLGFVDVSDNLLIGMLPSCIGSNSTNRTVLSSWNCLSNGSSKYQHPYSFCHKEALAVKPPSRSDQQQQQPSRKLGLILGIIGGVIGAAGVSVLLILLILKRAGRNQAKNYKCDSFVIEKGSFRSTPGIIGRHVPRTKRMASLGIPPYHVFTLEEMEDATNNFDAMNLVGGLGSQGQLYKGWLRDGSVVLVKCLKLKPKHSPHSLLHQIEVISKLRHRHLVSVLGHCTVTYQDHPNTASTVFIVLEYVTNGSLRDHLTDWRKREVLKWPQRMGITIGIARGIQFLHTGIVPGIFGNDLKIENILLDDNLIAKISGYNMTLTSEAVGSELPLSKQDASSLLDRAEDAEKDDIYELGAILLEVITGKPITSDAELNDLKLELERGLAEGQSTLGGVTDPSIRGTFAYDSLKTMVQITVNCLCRDSTNRPSIEDVLWHMQYSIQVQEGWTSSGNLSTKF
ncbi:probable LRR receptor-like serine/threonine-protein kinase At1g14390 [Cornus florida]|uniref:probable LRR receptor-like serine/threonine-protein kinase At1g14390 n=1 Tax=Cornus florida TaxID=4283 RepID=UPI00289CBC14|nr:probable LRR receptor-like serine/threonine-protein kinase At1g14390 [Cornus florida]